MVIVFLTHLFPDSSDNGVLLIGLELIIVVTFVTNIRGVINGVKSIISKEDYIWMKYEDYLGASFLENPSILI